MTQATLTAFLGVDLLCSGSAAEVALRVKATASNDILIFEDDTGRQIDLDIRGSDDEIVARYTVPTEPKARGRPKLGVVAREVTLLPRHWDWLAEQPGGASVALRRLIDTARGSGEARTTIRRAQEAADRVMGAILGNQPNYEEASRALYASDRSRFLALTEAWPADLRDYVRRQAAPAFPNAHS
jgi:hypothetical protein